MKNVIVRYPIDKSFKEKKFKVACTTKVTVLRSYVVQQLTQFHDIPFFLVLQTMDNVLTFLDEDKPLNKVSTAKRIRIQLIIQFFEADISRPGGNSAAKKYRLDLRATAGDNIRQLISSEQPNSKLTENNFAFCFKSKVDTSIPHLAINSMPLWFQGWSGEQLLLIQIIKSDDFAGMNDDNEEMYYKNCNMAVFNKLCLFNIEQWAKLSCLHFIINYYNGLNHNNNENSVNNNNDNSKNNNNNNNNSSLSLDLKGKNMNSILTYIPELFRNDETIVHIIDKTFPALVNHSKKQAYHDFVDICVNKGLSFCYIDRVKFLLLTKKWRMSSHRYLYLSPDRIAITKEFGVNLLYQEETQHITEAANDGDFVIVSFQKDEKWRIKSEKPEVLVSAIEGLPKSMISRRTSTTAMQRMHSGEIFAVNDGDLNGKISDDGYNNNSGNYLADFESTSNEFCQKLPKQKNIKNNNTNNNNNNNNEVETQSALFVDVRNAVLRHRSSSALLEEEVETLPGISKLICPAREEADEEYFPQNDLFRNLKVLEQLKLPINLNESVNLVKSGSGNANNGKINGNGGSLESLVVPDLNWLLNSGLALSKSQQKNISVLALLILVALIAYFFASST